MCEVHRYYIRYRWWDAVLQTGSGFLLGWVYLRTAGKESFLERWIVGCIEANPRLFKSDGSDQ